MSTGKPATVNIRPGVSVLSVLRHLNYKPWFALAEFVDNSIQSFQSERDKIALALGKPAALKVTIEIDAAPPARIVVRDNAAGIRLQDFPRAFRPAAVPTDRTGLSEFGMGMKSAACWFSPRWSVTTKALGESVARTVRFDVDHIVNDQIEELEISEQPASPKLHFTEIALDEVYNLPVKKTVGKIKEHLTDIYRVFIREGWFDLVFGDEVLTPEEPNVLIAPYARNPALGSKRWRKDIQFDFGNGLSATGFAALRDPGNYARCGFALFRRGRLIQGSGDEGYKPSFVFTQPGSFRSLRLFGELHLQGFSVSHTKDGFRWDENEQPFLELLKDHLDSDELPLLRQADDYRALESRADRTKSANEGLSRTVSAIQENIERVVEETAQKEPVDTSSTPLPPQPFLGRRELSIQFRGRPWKIEIEVSDDPGESAWLSVSDQIADVDGVRTMQIRVSASHPFMARFAQSDPEKIDAMLRMAAALALAEVLAREGGVRMAGTIRRNLNEILRDAMASPQPERNR